MWGGKPGLPYSRIRGNMLVAKMFADVIKNKQSPKDAMQIYGQQIEKITRQGDEI
jgi:hypothetical protein